MKQDKPQETQLVSFPITIVAVLSRHATPENDCVTAQVKTTTISASSPRNCFPNVS